MNRVVFDIECVGVDWDSLDETSQHALMRHAKTEEEKKEEQDKLALYPVTGFIVAIGMLNIDTNNAKVFYLDESPAETIQSDDGAEYVKCQSEKELLEAFWKDMRYFDQAITFNGRGFDVPYLLLRSAVHEVTPSIELMGYRYDARKHCDLADQLSFYGSARRFSLHMYTTAMGITSPKQGGIDGLAVPRLYAEGDYKTINDYCMRDVYATAELYKRWVKYVIGADYDRYGG